MKGPPGLDYLRKAFANHYGSYSVACTSLPLTMRWFASLKNCKDQEWDEHTNLLSGLMNHGSSSQEFLPPTALRTGESFMLKTKGSGTASTYLPQMLQVWILIETLKVVGVKLYILLEL